MTYWYLGVFETIGILKRRFPKVPVVLGGIYAQLCPEHAARSGADYLMADAGLDPPSSAPVPLDLYDRPEYAILATSRGCPRRCAYCASSLITPRFRPRPLEEIYADLRHQMSLGTTADVAFYDDALLWDKDNRFYHLCDHVRREYPGLRLHTPNGLSVDELDRRCCDVLRRSGFQTLRLSLEGVDSRTNAAGGGKTSRDNYRRATDNLLEAGYRPQDIETYLLAGLPGQRIEDVEESIEFVKSTGGRPKLCEFSPIPGTRLFHEALASTPVIAQEPLWHNNTVYTPYLSASIPPHELQRLKNMLAGDAKN